MKIFVCGLCLGGEVITTERRPCGCEEGTFAYAEEEGGGTIRASRLAVVVSLPTGDLREALWRWTQEEGARSVLAKAVVLPHTPASGSIVRCEGEEEVAAS